MSGACGEAGAWNLSLLLMNHLSRRALRLSSPALVLACGAVSAQSLPSTDLSPVVVTATRSAVPLRDVLADVTVIDRAQLDSQAGRAVADVLATVPGIQTARSGGPAGITSVYLRGAETRFTAVLVDGVRVDTQSTGGATWEAIPLSQVDRIEVVRGPASAVYGSDAIGGVVQIFTRKGEPGTRFDVGLGAGSFGTVKGDVGVSGRVGPVDYAVSLLDEHSAGFDARTNSNPDRDGYDMTGGSGRLGWQVNADHRLEASALRSHLDSQYDASRTADNHAVHELETVRASWIARWNAVWTSTVNVGQSEDFYETTPSPYQSRTKVRTAAWQNDLRLGDHSANVTLERREDHLDNSSVPADQDERSQDALALGYGWRSGSFALQANARQDRNDAFGDATTGTLAAGVDLAQGWRVQSSVGNGFRAPTLYQQYSESGVASLQPERSRLNVDLALVRRSGAFEASATAYHNRIANLIVYGAAGPCASEFGCYGNVGNAVLQGVTLAGSYVHDGLRVSGSFDYLSPQNRDTGLDLARRARRSGVLAVSQEVGDATVGAQLQAASRRRDADPSAFNPNPASLGGYVIVNADFSQKVAPEWRLNLRVDNLFDKDYKTAATYNTNPMGVFVSLRWTPKV